MQRWPLKDRAPVTTSRTARSRSASARTMAGFLASRPRMQRRRFGRGCCFFSTFATREEPMNASAARSPRLDEGPGHGAAVAVHDVHDAAREGVGEGLQQRGLAEHPVPRQLGDDGVAHDQGRDERRERLVQRVVERAHAEHRPERRAADLGEDAGARREAAGRAVHLLQALDGVADVLDRPVELLLRVGARLADLPHEEAHRLLAHLLHAGDEGEHRVDACAHAHRRPRPPAVVPRPHRRVERRERLLACQRGVRAHAAALDPAVHRRRTPAR